MIGKSLIHLCLSQADSTCDRLGILVGGKLKALGDASRLKRVYGAGHHLEITINLEKMGGGSMDNVADKVISSLRSSGVDTEHISLIEGVNVSETRSRLTFGLGVEKKRSSHLARGSMFGQAAPVPVAEDREAEEQQVYGGGRSK